MVKLDVSLLQFLEAEDFRVLTALEMASRNHVIAPSRLIEHIAQLPRGGCRKRLQQLLKHQLIHHETLPYDGYAMKYAAYDFLALNVFAKRGTISGFGHRIGCGKESDIFIVEDPNRNQTVLKLQRLGRCSFRSVARNRDYKNGRQRHGASWFYLSRLAAAKEFAFMKTLYDEGFPVPKPIDHNRHAVVMELVAGTLLNNIVKFESEDDVQKVYERCVSLIVKLAQNGLIHGDFNEFNIFVTDSQKIILIDFPQMVSTDHHNAADLFDRDVKNVAAFFSRRFKVRTLLYPKLQTDVERVCSLDRTVCASGALTRRDMQMLEQMMEQSADMGQGEEDDEEEEEESSTPSEEEDEEDAAAMIHKIDRIAGCGEELVDDGTTGAEAVGEAQHPQPEAEDAEGAEEEEEESGRKEPQRSSPPHNDKDDNESEGSGSGEEQAEPRKRRPNAGAIPSNPNFDEDGRIDMGRVRSKVKQDSKKKQERNFALGVRRNIQKDRAGRRIRRELRAAMQTAPNDW